MSLSDWWSNAPAQPLTLEMIETAARRMLEDFGRPTVEYHHPRCPKILTGGKKACRCGAAPLEAMFEDALAADRDAGGVGEGEIG